jgi:hypothetical protein
MALAARSPRLTLKVERILFNRGGCLLVVFTDACVRFALPRAEREREREREENDIVPQMLND